MTEVAIWRMTFKFSSWTSPGLTTQIWGPLLLTIINYRTYSGYSTRLDFDDCLSYLPKAETLWDQDRKCCCRKLSTPSEISYGQLQFCVCPLLLSTSVLVILRLPRRDFFYVMYPRHCLTSSAPSYIHWVQLHRCTIQSETLNYAECYVYASSNLFCSIHGLLYYMEGTCDTRA